MKFAESANGAPPTSYARVRNKFCTFPRGVREEGALYREEVAPTVSNHVVPGRCGVEMVSTGAKR